MASAATAATFSTRSEKTEPRSEAQPEPASEAASDVHEDRSRSGLGLRGTPVRLEPEPCARRFGDDTPSVSSRECASISSSASPDRIRGSDEALAMPRGVARSWLRCLPVLRWLSHDADGIPNLQKGVINGERHARPESGNPRLDGTHRE
eukprot:scaffold38639_cov51-Phaeocystis_antarctica.AAC.1